MSEWIAFQQARVERALEECFTRCGVDSGHPQLLAAMRYAVLGGGKRARALLVYAASQLNPTHDTALADACAVAVELIHAYSLVHDDLPCMDDDDLRRGKPSTHKAFGEAIALLAGDALQTLAFEVLSLASSPAEQALALVRTLATATGQSGMAGGQAIDLASTGLPQTETELENLHLRKTGALIAASVEMGRICARVDAPSLSEFARALGLAFQVHDDVLDVTGDAVSLGKTVGKDAAQHKTTYVSLYGLEGAQQKVFALNVEASQALNLPHTDALKAVQQFLMQRQS